MDEIDKSLGIMPMEGEIVNSSPRSLTVVSNEKTETENDYTYARDNFYTVIESGTKALEDMLDVARSSEHPRAYEVVATLMKTLIDANKDLVELSKNKNEDSPKDSDAKVVNNNLFVGSTAELQKMLKDMSNESN